MSRVEADADAADLYFLYSVASTYPRPTATIIDCSGNVVHRWSSGAEQVPPRLNPPSFLRGWNHVELYEDTGLLAVVPLHCVLCLNSSSDVVWKANIAAHHDVAMAPDGACYVLVERPKRVRCEGAPWIVLDNEVVELSSKGDVVRRWSLYDALAESDECGEYLAEQLRVRMAEAHRCGVKVEDLAAIVGRRVPLRYRLAALRLLPGSPADLMHANTLERLGQCAAGVWEVGDMLLSFRNLNLLAIVRLRTRSVIWAWGPGYLSGQHQPSGLPDGDILLFDNGVDRGRSRILRVSARARSITWEYTATPPTSLYSEVAGGCQLLSTGDILISDAQKGRLIIISPAGKVKWTHVVEGPPRVGRASVYRFAEVSGAAARRLTC